MVALYIMYGKKSTAIYYYYYYTIIIIHINKDFSSTDGKWREAQTASKKFVYDMIYDLWLLLLVVVVLLPACLPWLTMEWSS
jgi:hypothetical protein